MAFKLNGTLSPYGAPVKLVRTLANTVTYVTNDSVKLASGFVALGTAGALVFGHITALSDKRGLGLGSTGVAGAEFGSFLGSFLTASNNQTVVLAKAECDVSKMTLYSAEVSATLGTTTGSDLPGYRFDLVDEDTLDESTSTTGSAQYYSHGIDPENSARVIVNIYESEVYGV